MTVYRNRLVRSTWLLAACLGVASFTHAEQTQPLDSITAIAVDASRQHAQQRGFEHVSVEARPLDNRLRLPLCNQPLTTLAPKAGQALGAVSIGVRCNGEKPWTIYARTNVSAQQAVPVLTRPLARHDLITQEDLHFINQPRHASSNGIVYKADNIIGMALTRSLDADTPIKASYLRQPNVIVRGQQITLVTNHKGLEVHTQGKASQNATAGARVMVTNLSSGKKIEGIAHSDGTVHVP